MRWKVWVACAVLMAVWTPGKAQLAVQGDNYLVSFQSGLTVSQTGRALQQGNLGLNLRGGGDYWVSPQLLLRGAIAWGATLVPSVKLLAQESGRPSQTMKLGTALRVLALDRAQLQVDLGVGLGYTGFTYWDGSNTGSARPMGELVVKGLGAFRWLISSDLALGLDLTYGLMGGSFDREDYDLEILRSKFWFFLPPRYASAKLSFLLRNWPTLVVNGSLDQSWGGWSYEIELYQSAIVPSLVLQHHLMFEAMLFSPFLRGNS